MNLKKKFRAVANHVRSNRDEYLVVSGMVAGAGCTWLGLYIAFKNDKLVSLKQALDAISKKDLAGLYFHIGNETVLLTRATEEVRKMLLDAAQATVVTK